MAPRPAVALILTAVLLGACTHSGERIWPVMRSGSEFVTASWTETLGAMSEDRAVEIAHGEAGVAGPPAEMRLGMLIRQTRLPGRELGRDIVWAVVWIGRDSRIEVYVDAFSGELVMTAKSLG